jgi:hypothetical protein
LFSQAAWGVKPFGVSVSQSSGSMEPEHLNPLREGCVPRPQGNGAALRLHLSSKKEDARRALEQPAQKAGERGSDRENKGQAPCSDDDAERENDHVLKNDRKRDEDCSQRRKRVEP